MIIDVIVFAAHPDDAELSMGGTIKSLADQGYNIAIIDLTQGELGTRGSVEKRYSEAKKASEILGIALRENMRMPDGKLEANELFVRQIVTKIRQHRPKIIFGPYFNDRHPDHIGAGMIVKKAMFFSGLPKVITELDNKPQEAFRPEKLFYYMQTYEVTPSFISDISAAYEDKMKAVAAYDSQFFNPESEEPETFISKLNFTKYLEARAKYYGFKIGKDYGEPFFTEEAVELDLSYFLK